MKLETKHSTIKNYNYRLRNVSLNFSLDAESELDKRDFVELLKTAAAELQAEVDQTN